MSHTMRRVGLLLVATTMVSLTACSGKDKDKGYRVGREARSNKTEAESKRTLDHGSIPPPPPHRETTSPQDKKTESYQHRIDNPFRLANRVPLSTLSTSVDTASYSNIRRYLTDGHLPPADAVKAEEMINYFTYNYAQPEGNSPVSLAADVVRCPWNEQHVLVRVGLRGRTLDAKNLPPRNFVFLVDTSGSMDSPNRLPLLKQSLELLVDQMTERDRVAIVTYAGSAGLALDSTPGNNKQRILSAIRNLGAGGSTHGSAGIHLAYKIAQEHFIKDGLNRVILGTDGDFNVGTTSNNELIRLIEEKRKTGVYLTILGFGMGNLKDNNLEALAQHGNGHYAYIDTIDESRKLFVEQGAALVTIAKDVKLQVEFNPQRVGAYRLIGYETRLLKDEDFKNDAKDAGDMGAGHTVTALYEVVPAGGKINIPGIDPLKYQTTQSTEAAKNGDWLTVKMRYKHPEKETSEEVSLALQGEAIALEKASADFRFAASVAAFSMVLRDSPYRGQSTFDLAADLAARSLGTDLQGRRAEFVSLVRKAQTLKK